MKLTMLGTGNALVTECYNTCFVLSDAGQHFLVDGGGGSAILHQLKHAGIDWMDVRTIFVTHKHVDHLLGVVWMVRMICQFMRQGSYTGEATIYANDEVAGLLVEFAQKLLQPQEAAQIGPRLHIVAVADGEQRRVLGRPVTFFDIGSTKAKQFGFSMNLEPQEAPQLQRRDEGRLVCCGDEPCTPAGRPYAAGARWLLHEAFCLHSQADVFHPYEKHHSTVKDACELAEQLGVENLVIYHTEDHTLSQRRQLYTAEGRAYYRGNLFVPDDLDSIEL